MKNRWRFWRIGENLAAAANQPTPKDKTSADRRNEIQSRAAADIYRGCFVAGHESVCKRPGFTASTANMAADQLTAAQSPIDFASSSAIGRISWASRICGPRCWIGDCRQRHKRRRFVRMRIWFARGICSWRRRRRRNFPATMQKVNIALVQQLFPRGDGGDEVGSRSSCASRMILIRPDEIAGIHKRADDARKQMRVWAGNSQKMLLLIR